MLRHDTDFTLTLMSKPNNPDMFTQSGQWHDQTHYLTFEHTLAIQYVTTIQRSLQSLLNILYYPKYHFLIFPMHAWAYQFVCGMCISFIHYQGLFIIQSETGLIP